MANLKVAYVKCLNEIDLPKYLREENYTEVADIVKSKLIDGLAFVELNELELLKWRLTPKQKKIVLECKNAILSKNSCPLPIAKKPPVMSRSNVPPPAINKLVFSETTPRPEAISDKREEYVDMTQNMQKPIIESRRIAINPKVKNCQNETGRLKPEVKSKKIRPLPDTGPRFNDIKSALELQLVSTPKRDESKNAEEESDGYLTPVEVAPSCIFESNKQSRRLMSESEGIYEAEPDGAETGEHIYNEADEPVNKHFSANIRCKVSNNRQLKIPPPPASFKHLPPKATEFQSQNGRWLLDKSLIIPSSVFANPGGSDCNALDALSMSNLPKPPPFKNIFQSDHIRTAKLLLEAEEARRKTEIMLDAHMQEFLPMCLNKFNPNNCRFYRNTDRKGAEQLLKRIPNLNNGAFIFRRSEKFCMVITMYQEGRFYNVAIEFDNDGRFYCKGHEEEQIKFETLEDFIEYYEVNPVVVKSRGVCVRIYLRKLLLDDIY